MQRFYVYSTLTNDHAYTNWKKGGGAINEVIVHSDGFKEQILIKGGANLANAHIITPLGARTEITERQYECLQRNTMFQRHLKQQHLLVKNEADDPEIIARKYMQARDSAAPLTPNSDAFRGDTPDTVKPSDKPVKKVISAIRSMLN